MLSDELVTVTSSDEAATEEGHRLKSQSGPVSSFLDMVSSLYRGSSFAQRERDAKKDKAIKRYMQVLARYWKSAY